MILFVLDGSNDPDSEDRALLSRLVNCKCPVICICNKIDCDSRLSLDITRDFAYRVDISALTGEGMDILKSTIEALFVEGVIDYDNTPVLTGAHRHAMISTAIDLVVRAKGAVMAGLSPDVAALDLEMAAGELGRLDGRGVSETVVDSIFSRFCVGK